jgi:FtsP/CotA-like multicopper oxidase with cupredoxin domain
MKSEKALTRRQFLRTTALTGAALLVPWNIGGAGTSAPHAHAFVVAQQGTQTPLPGSKIKQFVDPLPTLSVAGGAMETVLAGTHEIKLTMCEFQANVMPSTFKPAGGAYTGTWVWGYRAGAQPANAVGTYIGPVIVATRDTPTTIRFVNNLTADHIAWRSWTDQTLHWAMGHGHGHYDGPIPAVAHFHGGEIPPVMDGGPDAWFTTDGQHGHAYYTMPGAAGNEAIYRFPNTQEEAAVWFHDHVLGATRLNVYAGLAGAYPIIDRKRAFPRGLHPLGLGGDPQGLPESPIVPLVLQDRIFDTNGQLFFPTVGINPEHPFWIPEFVGDTIVVNGKVWPYFNVQPKRYRFLLINGSNARAYELFLANPVTKAMGPAMWQIGTDGGYLDKPVRIDPNAPKGQLQKLVLMPGERADVIIDFAGFADQTLILRNTARTPYPKGTAPNGTTVGQIVQFRVQPGAVDDQTYDPASGVDLRAPMVRLANPGTGRLAAGVTANKTRQLTLNEVMGMGGPLEILVNNTKWEGKQADGTIRPDFTPVTNDGVTEGHSELPNEGDTEVWEVVNLTADAHPIHLHLTHFQLINRQSYNVSNYNGAYGAAFPSGVYQPSYGPPLNYDTGNPRALGGNPDITPFLQGKATPLAPNEAGWKDTVIMYPGQVTRIAMRFAPMHLPATAPADILHYPFDPNAGGHGYVWHCHIIDHEDNEMMRPYSVEPKANVTRTYAEGVDY